MIGFLSTSLKYIVSVVNGDLLVFFLMIVGEKICLISFSLYRKWGMHILRKHQCFQKQKKTQQCGLKQKRKNKKVAATKELIDQL